MLLLMWMLSVHVCLPLLVLLMLRMLAVPHVSVGRHEDRTREVVLQQVSRDRHAVTLRIGRGHGGAVGLSQAGTPWGVHPIRACPSVMPVLRTTALMRRRKHIGIRSPLLRLLGLSSGVCDSIWKGAGCSCLIWWPASRGVGRRGGSLLGVAEPSSVQMTVQLLDVPGQDVIRHRRCSSSEQWRHLAWRLLWVLALVLEGWLRRLRAHVRKQLLQYSLLLAHPPTPLVWATACHQAQIQLCSESTSTYLNVCFCW